MKKILTSLLTASLLVSNMGVASVTDIKAASITNSKKENFSITDLSKYETNDVIVVYKKESNATKKKTFGICSLAKEDQKNASVDLLTDNSVVLSLDSKDTLEDAIEALSNDSRVDYIQPNYVYHLTDTENKDSLDSLQKNPSFVSQWGFYNDGTFTYEDEDYRLGGSQGGSDWYDWFPWFPWSESYIRENSDISMESYSQSNTFTVTAKNGVDIKLAEAWKVCASAKRETVVAIVDTGVKYDHEDLKDSMWVNEDEIADDGIDNDNNGYVDDIYGWNFYDESSSGYWGGSQNTSSSYEGNNEYYNKNSTTEDAHGTHGAGSIAAKNDTVGTVGVAANANVKIMTVKALGGAMGYGTTESVIKGIQYAEENGAHICNLSLGGEEDDAALRSVIKNSKMLFTIAAGNGDSTYNGVNNDNRPTYPASYNFDNTITVANLQCDGTLHYSSNYGVTSVHLAAPGAKIYSTSTDSSGYEYMTGTSMAAPMVAGVASMLYSCYDHLSITDVKKVILNTTTKLDDLGGTCISEGMLNAYAAVIYAETGEIPVTEEPVNTPTIAPTGSLVTPNIIPTTVPTQKPSFSSEPTIVPVYTKKPEITRVPKFTKKPEETYVPVTNIPTNTKEPIKTKVPVTEKPVETMPAETPTDHYDDKYDQTPLPQITNNPISTMAPTIPNAPISDLDFVSIKDFSVSGEEIRFVGDTYTVKALAKGGTGNYQYRFSITKDGITKKYQGYSNRNNMEWTPSSAGTYVIHVSVKDDNGDYDVWSQVITISRLKISNISANKKLKKGTTVKLKIAVKAGKAPYTYKFNITRLGKKVLSKKTKNSYVKWKITKKGIYKIKVKVTDALGNCASKTITYKVK